MQSHGQKRTPEEFKEIRKEWKQKKKDEEQSRKAEEERQRAAEDPVRNPQQGSSGPPVYGAVRTQLGPPPNMGAPQLPPMPYAPPTSGTQPQSSYGAPSPAIDGMSHYPTSPYQNNQMYPPGR